MLEGFEESRLLCSSDSELQILQRAEFHGCESKALRFIYVEECGVGHGATGEGCALVDWHLTLCFGIMSKMVVTLLNADNKWEGF
ncbi:hypothetical protein Q3G72_032945 [Acer saccharum]|nr:hypothetical protein Q3G72_032945 [Acer saccharum]